MNPAELVPVVVGILAVVLTAAFALWPLVSRPMPADPVDEMDAATEVERGALRQGLYRQVLDLEFDLQTGKLSAEDYQALSSELLEQAALLMRADAVEESSLDEMIEQEIAAARLALASPRPRVAQEAAR